MARIKEIFAHNLKENRRKSGFTQAQLAEKVDVSTHHIGMLEIARNYPTNLTEGSNRAENTDS
jgi:DNA-binding XRE family transcriptional regulator